MIRKLTNINKAFLKSIQIVYLFFTVEFISLGNTQKITVPMFKHLNKRRTLGRKNALGLEVRRNEHLLSFGILVGPDDTRQHVIS